MPENWLTFNEAHIYYKTQGKGLPVILIHGFGEDGSIWQHQEAILAKYFRVIIPDIPGSGKSESLRFSEAQTVKGIEQYADCIRAILDQEQIVQCTMLGHSMGGYITLAFAAHYPARLNGIGLVHSSAFSDNEEKREIRKKGIHFIEEYGAKKFLEQAIPNLFGIQYAADHPEQIQTLINTAGNFTNKALVQYYKSMMTRPDRSEMLKNLTIPVLFVIGEADKSVPLEDSLKQCHFPKKVLINILPGVAHMGMWEKADQVNDTMLKFLNYIHDG